MTSNFVTSTDPLHRDGFRSLRAGGLNWESFPLKLFVKGNKKFWDPDEIDFSREAADWQSLSEVERTMATMLCAQFIAGEEAVTEDIQPFMSAMAVEGRIGDEMYLAQFCFEEAKHVQVFRRWLDAVGITEDLSRFVSENPGYRKIFYEELPASLRVLRDDPSPLNQVRASVTYNHVVEGALALTGYFMWNKVCTSRGILPGMQELVRRIGDDERRHMAWGTFTCRRHVAADDSLWQVVQDRIGELLPHAVAQIEWAMAQYDEEPFGLTTEQLIQYATDRALRRLGTIESARGQDVRAIDIDAEPEALEEKFNEEDSRQLADAAA